MLEQLEDEYLSAKNKLKLKHTKEILELKQKYKEEKKQVTEDFEKNEEYWTKFGKICDR